MKKTIPLKELDERIKAVANDEQTSAAVRELVLLQGQIIQGLSAQVETHVNLSHLKYYHSNTIDLCSTVMLIIIIK